METKFDTMCDWERKKAVFLMGVAETLGMDTSEYGELAVNQNSGNTYLWLEMHNFTLYMPISCELEKKDVYALWTSSEDGREEEISIGDMNLEQIENWATEHEKKLMVEVYG